MHRWKRPIERVGRLVVCSLLALCSVLVLSALASATPEPTYADFAYGPHERNVLDLWLAPSDVPTPLVILIHGGGFRGGDKSNFVGEGRGPIDRLLAAGLSVAAINYRLTDGGENPYPIPMLDGARAVQFLRHQAARLNLDPAHFGAMGGSAGGCMLMWLGFHDDLADADHEDPVLRESSRLQALAPSGGQSTLHLPTLEAWFGVESLVEHAGFRPLFALPSDGAIELSEDLLTLMADASPITHLTVDDPPIYLSYAIPNLPVDEETSPNVWVHHPMFGIELKAQMDVLGIECHVWYPGGPSVDAYASQEAFLVEILTQP